MRKEKEEKVNKLKNYLEKEEDIVLAFLFGSYAKNKEREISDVDIGIYTARKWDLKKFHKVWDKLEEILGKNVDLIIMNEARETIVWEALRGIPLKIKDKKFYYEYMLKVSREAEDFADFVIDFYRWREKVKNEVK